MRTWGAPWAVIALVLAGGTAYAAPVITDATTCQKIIGYTLSEDNIPALHLAIGRYEAALFTHYGVPVPHNLEDFGMNVGLEAVSKKQRFYHRQLPLPGSTAQWQFMLKLRKYSHSPQTVAATVLVGYDEFN
jgi:hypothetical protein